MGRSRITRTFHNKPKPVTRASNKPSTGTNPKQTVQRLAKGTIHQTKNKGGITRQAHAQEEQNVSKTAYKAKSKAKAIKQQRDWHSPLTLFASGMGNQAHDIGGSVHGLATGQDYQVKSVLNRAAEHAFAGDWDSAGRVISDNPYRFAGNVATEAGLAIIPFGMVARGVGIAGKVGSVASKVSKGLGKAKGKTPKSLGINTKPKSSGRSNTAAKFPIERRFDTTIKTAKISKHNQAKLPDQIYFQKGLPGSVIPSDLVKPGTFYTQRARWNPNRGAVFRVSDRQKIGGPKGTGSFKDLRGTTSSDNQHMSQFSKYPVPNSVVKAFAKDGKVKRPSDGKTIKSLVWYEGQFTPKNPYVPGG